MRNVNMQWDVVNFCHEQTELATPKYDFPGHNERLKHSRIGVIV